MAMTIPVRTKRSIGTWTLKMATAELGRIDGSVFGSAPKASSIPACAMSSRPSVATSLASGVAVRSGRKAANSVISPASTATTRLMMNAGASPTTAPYVPSVSDQKAYAVSMDTAPAARLITPLPR